MAARDRVTQTGHGGRRCNKQVRKRLHQSSHFSRKAIAFRLYGSYVVLQLTLRSLTVRHAQTHKKQVMLLLLSVKVCVAHSINTGKGISQSMN